MARHNHQLNFVMNLKSTKFAAEMDKIAGGTKVLRKALQLLQRAGDTEEGKKPSDADNERGKGGIISKIFLPKLLKRIPKDLKLLAGQVGFLGATFAGLGIYLSVIGKRWFSWFNMIMDTRKEMGLTLPEAQKFGANVLSMTARFGVAMDKVSNIARFVGAGTKIAHNSVVQLAGALAMISEASGASEQAVGDLGFLLHRTMGLNEEAAEAASAGVLGVARNTGVTMDALIGHLKAAQKAIFIAMQDPNVSGEQALSRIAALAAGMVKAGASTAQVDSVMATLGDRSSNLFKVWAGGKFSLENLNNYMEGIAEQIKSGAIAAASAGEIWDKLGPITLAKLAESAKGAKVDVEEFNRILAMTPEERAKWVAGTIGPLQRLGLAWGKFFGEQTKAFNEILGGPMTWFLNKIADIADGAVYYFNLMTKNLGYLMFIMGETWVDIKDAAIEVFGDIWTTWKSMGGAAIDWIGDKLKAVWDGLKKAKAFVDTLTGKSAAVALAAENAVPLNDPRARNIMIQEGLSPAQANAKFTEILRQRALTQGPASLTPQEHKIVYGTDTPAPIVNVPMPVTPVSEAPGTRRDPGVELMKEQLKALNKIGDAQEEAAKKADLDRSRYPGGSGGGSSSHPTNPMVDTQRI
jgi:hypothetical protein